MASRMSQEEFERRVKEYTDDKVLVISPYINKRTMVDIKCKTCGHEWKMSSTRIMPSNIKQYSFSGCPECKYEEVECHYCHKKFKRLKSQLEKDNKTGFVYCSRECGNRHKNEQVKINNDGVAYRRNAFEVYPHECAICGYNEEERILEVHHIDENRGNNKIDNLVILCPNCHKKITLHLSSYEELLDKYRR